MEEMKLTAGDQTSYDQFGGSVSIIGDTLLVSDRDKDGNRESTYVFIAGDGSWHEGTDLIPRNGISSGDLFGYAVALPCLVTGP